MALSRRNRRVGTRDPATATTTTVTRSVRPGALTLLLCCWAIAATWIAIADHREIGRLTDEADSRQAAHEDKVRALMRRFVGVASHGMLEQEGLAGRLAEIVTRQVELENRQAALAAMAERGMAERGSTGLTPAAAPPPPGGDSAGREARPGRGTALDRERLAPLGGAGAVERMAALPIREQFDNIEAALTRSDAVQMRTIDTLIASARSGIERVQAVLATLHLALTPPPASARAVRPGVQDPFAKRMVEVEDAVDVAGRWHAAAEALPLRPPIEGEGNLTSNFGVRKDPFTGAARMHAGMDFRSPIGTPVKTRGSGRVVSAGPSSGYGNLVEIDHGHGLVTRYAHLSTLSVAVDQPVAAGTVVGLVGSTGRSTGPHLHYETRLDGSAVDPARFLAAGEQLYGRSDPAAVASAPEGDAAD